MSTRELFGDAADLVQPIDLVDRAHLRARQRRWNQVATGTTLVGVAVIGVLITLVGVRHGAATDSVSTDGSHSVSFADRPFALPLKFGQLLVRPPLEGQHPSTSLEQAEAIARNPASWPQGATRDHMIAFGYGRVFTIDDAEVARPFTLTSGNLEWLAVYRSSTAHLVNFMPDVPAANRPPYIQLGVVIDGTTSTQQTVNLGAEPQSEDPRFVADYVRYVTWAATHCPNLTPPAQLTTSCHVRYLRTRPETYEETRRGVVQGSTGKVIAPPKSRFIGDGFHPQQRLVDACRAGTSQNHDCGLDLTIADGKFHAKASYRANNGGWYSPHAIAKAIAAAGYASKP